MNIKVYGIPEAVIINNQCIRVVIDQAGDIELAELEIGNVM